ncbi:MAG: hypothetical protein NZM04_00520, partial [Methylacidiphilales bacterium]|nr:hypothetical protein [Candidatus Methylacidiphilales bacterium]
MYRVRILHTLYSISSPRLPHLYSCVAPSHSLRDARFTPPISRQNVAAAEWTAASPSKFNPNKNIPAPYSFSVFKSPYPKILPSSHAQALSMHIIHPSAPPQNP